MALGAGSKKKFRGRVRSIIWKDKPKFTQKRKNNIVNKPSRSMLPLRKKKTQNKFLLLSSWLILFVGRYDVVLTKSDSLLSLHDAQTLAWLNKHTGLNTKEVKMSYNMILIAIFVRFSSRVFARDEWRIYSLLPRDIANEHPVTVLVFIRWDAVRAIQKIHQLALIHEFLHSLGSTITFSKENMSINGALW